ncbi:MAG: class I SAM-dependent methyltransferase [Candidatus Thorarchaeota archaeon]|jgi:SAM-dependent methyltransferase
MPDIFGMIMKDAASGKEAKHETERDDGHVRESYGRQYIAPFSEWHECERLAGAEAKGKILDVGCGAGRAALHFQEKGHEVVGIDISPGAIETSRNRGVKNVHLMSVENLDFPDNTFDTVLMFGNNFGVLGDEEKIVAMLRDLHRITKSDAVILASTRDVADTDNPVHLEFHERNRSKGIPIGLVKLRLKYQGHAGDWWLLRMVNSEEMSEIADNAGWKLVKTYGPPSEYTGVLRKK